MPVFEAMMLRWAFAFLVMGLVADILGFTGLTGAAVLIAACLFLVFMMIFPTPAAAGLVIARRITS